MNYLKQIEMWGLMVVPFSMFIKKKFSEGLDVNEIIKAWEDISEGSSVIFSYDLKEFYSLKRLLRAGILLPKESNVKEIIEKECKEYFKNRGEI